jgi:hypothetical protein
VNGWVRQSRSLTDRTGAVWWGVLWSGSLGQERFRLARLGWAGLHWNGSVWIGKLGIEMVRQSGIGLVDRTGCVRSGRTRQSR